MRLGYARVSTKKQKLEPQVEELEAAGCEKVFSDVASGAYSKRPGLERLLEHVREGDAVVVTRLDRLGRSVSHLLQLVEDLKERGAHLESITQQLDTSTINGRLIFNVFAMIAEFERELIKERSEKGRESMRRKGVKPGRKALDDETLVRIYALHDADWRVREIADVTGVAEATIYKYLGKREDDAAA